MRVILGADHRGFDLKTKILSQVEELFGKQDEIIDVGCYSNEETDFTDVSFDMIDQWNENSIGILICKTGIGMSICINRFPYIRGAICKTIDDTISAREHNNANVLILGAHNNNDDVMEIIRTFLQTKFNNDAKYARRVEQMTSINDKSKSLNHTS